MIVAEIIACYHSYSPTPPFYFLSVVSLVLQTWMSFGNFFGKLSWSDGQCIAGISFFDVCN